jgi:hypothetical protein
MFVCRIGLTLFQMLAASRIHLAQGITEGSLMRFVDVGKDRIVTGKFRF